MKKIALKNITKARKSSIKTRERYNTVFLGNGITAYFSNIHDARAFVAATNRTLNEMILELNSIYIDTWREFRTMYIIFFEIFNKSDSLKGSFQIVERAIDLALTRSSWINGNHFTFNHINNIIESLTEVNTMIIALLREKGRNYNVYQHQITLKRLKAISKEINEIGSDYKNSAPPAYYDKNIRNHDASSI